MQETWLNVPGFPSYEVSDHGRVRRAVGGQGTYAGLILKSPNDGQGRPVVALYTGDGKRKTVRVSRLVAFAFLGNPPHDDAEVCHGDGNSENNLLGNLRWDTHAGNMLDMKIHGTSAKQRGSASGKAKLTDAQVAEIRASVLNNVQLGALYGVHNSQISRIRNGVAW